MTDREKVIQALDCCLDKVRPGAWASECIACPYVEYDKCLDSMIQDALALLKEQEEREKAICKEICDFIRGACSTDTDDDKDFVCYEIQKCFMEGR